MIKQIFIGLYTEGVTDIRFLETVVKNTFEEVAFQAPGNFEFFIEPIRIDKTDLKFTDQVLAASKEGIDQFGISVLCIHRDADHINDDFVFENSINPALDALKKMDNNYCKAVVVIVPIQMIEAWLLADKELFKKEIGTTKSNIELGIDRRPESISNPKQVIEEAIRIARRDQAKRRRKNLTISQLYMPLGQKIDNRSLNSLGSYRKFRDSVEKAFIELNLLNG